MKSVLDYQIKYPRLLLSIILVLTLVAGYIGATQIVINPTFEVLIPQDSEWNTNDRKLSRAFGSTTGVLILARQDRESILQNFPERMDEPYLMEYYDELTETLNESQYVKRISDVEISDDGRYARMSVAMETPNGPEGTAIIEAELNQLVSQVGTPPGVKTEVTGFPLLLNKISYQLINDSINTMFITLGMILAVLFFYFRRPTMTLITIITPIICVVVLAFFMVLFGIEITVPLAAVGVFMLGIGVDYGVHFAVHYQDERKHGHTHIEALRITVKDLWHAITASFFTTLAGFAALTLGVSPSSQANGSVLAIGIVIIYISTLLIVPILIVLFGKHASFHHNQTFDEITKALSKLAIYQSRHPIFVLVIIGFITMVMFGGLMQVEFSTSNSNWIPDDDPLSIANRESFFTFGDSDSLTIILESERGDLRDPWVQQDVEKLIAVIEGIPGVESVDSAYTNLPDDDEEAYLYLTNEKESSFTPDYRFSTLTIRSETFPQDANGDALLLPEVEEILERFPVANTKTGLFGDSLRFKELGESLQGDAGQTTLFGFILVFIVAGLAYTSAVVGFTALLPIIIAVIWGVGLMGYFGVPFTSLSTGIVSLVLGVGADFSIHIVDGIKRYTQNGKSLEKAIDLTLRTTGGAILLSSTTTLFGFLALTGAKLLGTQRLGLSLALAMVASFIVVITMVPAIMSLYLRKVFKEQGG